MAGKKTADATILREFDAIIRERAYSMIFKELTEKEREILLCAVKPDQDTNEAVMKDLSMKKGTLSTYKKRLCDAGIIEGDARGKIKWALPRFEEYLRYLATFED